MFWLQFQLEEDGTDSRSINIMLVSHMICLTVNSGSMTRDRVFVEGDHHKNEGPVHSVGSNTRPQSFRVRLNFRLF